MDITQPSILLPILLAMATLGFLTLGRGPRPVEGRMVSILIPLFLLMAITIIKAKSDEFNLAGRVNINAPRLNALDLSEAAGISPELAERVIAYRNAMGGGIFSSALQIPSLGRASKEEVRQLETWAVEKNWKEIQRVMRTGELRPNDPQATVGPEEEGQTDRAGQREGGDVQEGFGISRPVIGRGLYPSLDLQVRAAALLPNPPFLLDTSPRSKLLVALGDPGVVRRVVQSRTLEPGDIKFLSDVPSLPEGVIVLRDPDTTRRTFTLVMGGLLLLFLLGHLYLARFSPHADQALWPVFGGLSLLGVLMLFAVAPPLTARGNVWPLFGDMPEYAGQGIVVAVAMLLLPFAASMLAFSKKVGSRALAGMLAAAILLPNVLSEFGESALFGFLIVTAGAGAVWYYLQTRSDGETPHLQLPFLKPLPRDANDPSPDLPVIQGEDALPAPQMPGSNVEKMQRLRPLLVSGLFLLAVVLGLTLARMVGGKTGYAPLVEVSKVLLILFTARLCSDYEMFLGGGAKDLPMRARWELIGCWIAAMLLAVLSDDLGFLLLLWIPFTLLFSLSIGRVWPVFAGLGGLAIGAAILSANTQTRFPERIQAWLDPWNAPSTQMAEAFQRMASVPSVAAGTGLGEGTRLVISTDTRDVILPLYFEQLGWVGLLLVVTLLLIGIHRLFFVGLRARESYAHWVSLGFGCVFAVQTVYMIGAGFGAWPLTGMTLAPLASGKAAAFFTIIMALLALAASSEPSRAAVPDRRGRARFVSAAFAVFAVLTLFSVGKAAKTAVVDAEQIALKEIGGRMNRRSLQELYSLKIGRIVARKNSLEDYEGNVAYLAVSREDEDGHLIRKYPEGAAFFPVTGVRAGVRSTGGEAAWESRLAGLDAFLDKSRRTLPPDTPSDKLLLDLWQRKHHPLFPKEDKIAPQDVQTTLIADVQKLAYNALKDRLQNTRARSGSRPRKGAMLIADVRTGEVLAYAQYPAPSPSLMAQSWEAWDNAAHHPSGFLDKNGNLIDLVRHTDRAPGSTAKINTMLALSEEGKASETFPCRHGIRVNGAPIRDHNDASHGTVGLREILKYSCNRGASQAAAEIGSDALLEQYRKLRYDLPHMDRPEQAFRNYYQQIAFGQAISSSLWEIATSAAAVARGGEAIELQLVRKRPELVEKWRVASPETAARVAEGMRAVTEPGGTAWAVYRGEHDWPSKTGSAEIAGAKETDAWFVGYAPRRNPALVFVVWAEEDGTGSGLAQSINLSNIIERCLLHAGVVEEPIRSASRTRSSRPSRPQNETEADWLERLLAHPDIRREREFIEEVEDGFNRAREGVGQAREIIDALRALGEERQR